MSQKKPGGKGAKPSPAALLAWYDGHRRVLPWRALPGERPNPYHVWLSEIMLQQTTVVAVGPYFRRFIDRWPDLPALAAAPLEAVRQLWAGLGYYRRASALHACAGEVARRFGGLFPETEPELLSLPGIGPYTAAAIAAIAFDRRANVVDGNVERVMARFFAVETPLPGGKAELRVLAEENLPTARFGDYAQALMDLGATVCTPRSPKCDLCPWARDCAAKRLGIAGDLPARVPKKAKPVRRAFIFVAQNASGAVFLQRRPEKGLLAGLLELPSTPWGEGKLLSWAAALAQAPFSGAWRRIPGIVHHTFTHFDLELSVAIATIPGRRKGLWVAPEALDRQALPSVMKKVLRLAVPKEATRRA